MATFQYFPSPLPFAHPFSPPPPPHVVPPPPHVVPPPPRPPPPHVVPSPPPPHVRPPPPPPLHPVAPPPHIPPPSPDNPPTVIIVVFVSFGCFFFAAFCCFALCCLIKRKQKKMVNETDIISTDEHLRVKEAVVQGPNGPELVVLSIEDDKNTHEEIIKNERVETKQLNANAKSGDIDANHSNNNNQIHNLL